MSTISANDAFFNGVNSNGVTSIDILTLFCYPARDIFIGEI